MRSGINRWHGDTQPPEGRRQHGPAGQASTGTTYNGSGRWRTTPKHIRNDTGHWTKRKSGHSVRGWGRCDGAGWATLTGWLPWPGCELAHARAPNSIYILIKTAPLASPTPTRPATTPNPPPIHPTPVFLFVKASTIKYISVRNVGEGVRSPVRRRDLQVRSLCFNQLSLRALLTGPHLPIFATEARFLLLSLFIFH